MTMKKAILLYFAVFLGVSLAQESYSVKPFSSYGFGFSVGSNFQTIKFPGASFLFEIKTPLTNNLGLKLSGGFSLIFEDKSFVLKYNKLVSIQGIEKYSLITENIKKIEHSIIPIYAGFEYKFLDDDLSPYALLDIGYVYYNSESVVTPPRSGILVDTIEEIPEEYRNPIPHLRKSGTFLGAGIGAGLKYKLSTATEIMITYVFRYNNKIINSNNILLGISF